MPAQTTPIVSRVCDDGTLIEALYDVHKSSTSLAICTPDGRVSIAPDFALPNGECLVAYSAANNLLSTGCVLLPSAVGDFEDKGDLVRDIQAFLHRHVDLSPVFKEISAHYVLLSWVHDAFNELGYLRFRGDYGTGKTRALLAVGSLCYKPFFASGASTVSPIFHVLDAIGGTLVLDEADLRFSDATADLTKILNNGTVKGLPVLRTMSNRHRELNPHAFRVFGPKLIGMRESFADKALESRFLTEETGVRPLRSDIPIHLPESLSVEATALRNRLLAWRFYARHRVGPDPARLVPGLEPRRNQTALALLSLVDDEVVRQRIATALVGEEARVLNERASSFEATMLRVLLHAFERAPKAPVSVSDATRLFNEAQDPDEPPRSCKWVGSVLRTKLRLRTERVRGVYVIPRSERRMVETLAVRYGIVQPNAVADQAAPGFARAARAYA
ncbi:hypothetical protein [Brevundimonas sp. A19_0]|uniref:hypothetical protein n=1 Tax=Brevundimonas sp. A19_0 TaxID=2821087 RepID=UPI001ADB025C|nr:hypothetical protein [Brevundimonas sp. A19_0]MBO9501190.1 hypothetical protein [Brevundimonas sp. A19_0]